MDPQVETTLKVIFWVILVLNAIFFIGGLLAGIPSAVVIHGSVVAFMLWTSTKWRT